ncbi:MAG: OmpA family protein [Actinomycetota bacterium]|nr:OmpA family protein [Actinomycetota bacterium]
MVQRDGTVGFVPDQAVFRDPGQARAVLTDYAREIANGRRALLTGTTASAGTSEYRLRLSQQRADAVRDLLVSLGAPADRIGTQGLGSDFPGYVKDRDPQGNVGNTEVSPLNGWRGRSGHGGTFAKRVSVGGARAHCRRRRQRGLGRRWCGHPEWSRRRCCIPGNTGWDGGPALPCRWDWRRRRCPGGWGWGPGRSSVAG